MLLGIIGNGTVGTALARRLTQSGRHRLTLYDKFIPALSTREHIAALAGTELVFVAVPTPYDPALQHCDVSAVIEAMGHAGNHPVCIKSTIPPGTLDALRARFPNALAYAPEFLGESPGHPWPNSGDCGFDIVAGDEAACQSVRRAYAEAGVAGVTFVETDVASAELAKYAENCFLATKVAFANQFYDLATSAGADFEEVRRLFLLDSRCGESHTRVTPERGFGGKCIPKDLASIIAWARDRGGAPLLEAVEAYNLGVRSSAAGKAPSTAA
jgi:UDPglucose 6-dehydrogenase